MSSRPIQQIPGGLLGFLQLKNAGQNPSELPASLQAVLEMREWYWQSFAQVAVGTDAAIAAAGFVDKITVPAGEYWAIHDVAVVATLAAASNGLFVGYYRNGQGAANQFPFNLSDPQRWTEATDGAALVFTMRPRDTLLLQPGAVLGIRTLFLSAATTTGNMTVRYTRLQA